MADGIVINKADGSNIEKAKLAASHFRNALHLFPAPDSGWSPKVMTYSGFYGIGIKEIWDMIYEYFAFVKANGYLNIAEMNRLSIGCMSLSTSICVIVSIIMKR